MLHALARRGAFGGVAAVAAIRERLGPFDLMRLSAGAFLPVHWGTFSLLPHAWDEPAESLHWSDTLGTASALAESVQSPANGRSGRDCPCAC